MSREPTLSDASPVWSPTPVHLLAFALLSGLGILALTSMYPFFDLRPLPEMGLSPSPEVVSLHKAASFAFYTSNSSVLFAGIGAILGLTLALAAGQRRRGAAALSGIVGGATFGALSGFAAGALLDRTLWLSEDESLVRSFGLHLAAWAPVIVGTVGGVGWQQSSLARACGYGLGGILVAILVVAGYCLAASILFQNTNLTYLYPQERSVQITWSFMYPLLAALGLMLTLRATNTRARQNDA